jgi:hypothetical protein
MPIAVKETAPLHRSISHGAAGRDSNTQERIGCSATDRRRISRVSGGPKNPGPQEAVAAEWLASALRCGHPAAGQTEAFLTGNKRTDASAAKRFAPKDCSSSDEDHSTSPDHVLHAKQSQSAIFNLHAELDPTP